MLRSLAISLALLAFATPATAVELNGHLVPGGFVIGEVEPGATVLLGETPVEVAPDGRFVIGFGRDQGPEAQLTIIHADGKSEQQMLSIAPRQYEIQRIDQLDQNMVTPDPETEARIKADQAKVKGQISGVYGSQRILNGVPKAPHFGTDIAAPEGAPVVAPADGMVRLAETGFYLTGGTVIIDHGLGLYSSYLHLSRVDVVPGQELRQGDMIGAVGKTGRATGPHLHWGLNWNETRLDPALLVPPMVELKP